VADASPIPLGEEPIRYYQHAAADAATAPSDLDQRLAAFATGGFSGPLLPQAPVGHGDDGLHMFVRAVLEDIAVAESPAGTDSADILRVLASIDAMRVGQSSGTRSNDSPLAPRGG
jgi:hypothetical protein